MSYKFKLKLAYDLESDNEQDAIQELVDLIRRDWPYYADEGDLVEVKGKRRKIVMRSRSRDKVAPLQALKAVVRKRPKIHIKLADDKPEYLR